MTDPNAPVIFTGRQADRIANAVKVVEAGGSGLGDPGTSRRDPLGRPMVMARITGVASGRYSWVEIDAAGADVSGGLSGTTTAREAIEISGATVPTGAKVLLFRAAVEDEGTYRPVFVFTLGGGGGSGNVTGFIAAVDGGESFLDVTASYTYTLFFFSDPFTPVATGLSPAMRRPGGVARSGGELGMGIIGGRPATTANPLGIFLLWVDETDGTTICFPPELS